MLASQARLRVPFMLYLSGQFMSALGSSFTAFAIPLLVFRLTGSSTGLGLALAASFLPYLLFGLIIGALTDRLDRRRLMIGADIGRATVLAAVPIIHVFADLTVWPLYVAAFITGTLGIFFDTGAFASVPKLVDKSQLVRANGLLEASFSAARLLGPVLAGVAATLMPLEWILAIDAGSFLLSAASILLVGQVLAGRPREGDAGSPEKPGVRASVKGLAADVKEGMAFIWRNAVLRSIAVLMCVVNFLDATVLAQLVFLAVEQLDATPFMIAWLFAAGQVGVLVFASVATSISARLPFVALTLGSEVVCGLTILLLGLNHIYWVALVLWALFSGAGILFNISTTSLRQRIVPDALLGRVMSVSAVLAWSAVPIGAVLGGVVISVVGNVGYVYAGIGGLVAVVALAFLAGPLRNAETYLCNSEEVPLDSNVIDRQ